MSMLNRRGFLNGIMGAVALIAAAPALRVADAVIPGPPPPKPKTPGRTMVFVRYEPIIKVADSGGPPPGSMGYNPVNRPVPAGWVVCDGREIPKGTYAGLELAMGAGGRFGRYPYGETLTAFRVPDLIGATRV
jgi:hypothetical protein